MDRLGYTAMTAANRTMLSLQIRANNLANASTSGFRADLEQAEASAVDGYGYASRHLTRVRENGVDLRQGPMVATGRELDFAIRGAGLIAVGGPQGERYTRNGNLQVDAGMQLTILGRPVLDEGGGPIVLPEYDSLSIGRDGIVSVVPRGDFVTAEVGRIKLVNLPAEVLRKDVDGLLATAGGEPVEMDDEVRLAAGYLEGSNVSAIDQLVASMSLNRLFEAQVKMMKAAEALSEAGNRMIRGQ